MYNINDAYKEKIKCDCACNVVRQKLSPRARAYQRAALDLLTNLVI